MCKKTVALEKIETELLGRTEVRMLRWILRRSPTERMRNEEIHKRAGVVSSTETRLRWFGHVMKKKDEEPTKKTWNEPIRGKRSRIRQIKVEGRREKT